MGENIYRKKGEEEGKGGEKGKRGGEGRKELKKVFRYEVWV